MMIDEGCLEGVKEVWGLHVMPWDPINQIHVKEGVMMYGAMQIFLKIKGKGGHSSLKKQLTDPLYPVSEIIVKME